uniref:Putative reverse transcriptase n=1 Tax=Entransia fimbriata TaxID=130991 RepID=U5YE93_9VIRI|nr:putative reverse transcriptase [Entransia fimbriata]AGZ90313.1 putative reverse transcriptase [Entransia fimbriata]
MGGHFHQHVVPANAGALSGLKLQEDLVKAYNVREMKAVSRIERKIVTSLYGQALAVRRVVSSSGGNTPGIDKKRWDSPLLRFNGIEALRERTHNPKDYVASPLKRVWIPKARTLDEKDAQYYLCVAQGC